MCVGFRAEGPEERDRNRNDKQRPEYPLGQIAVLERKGRNTGKLTRKNDGCPQNVQNYPGCDSMRALRAQGHQSAHACAQGQQQHGEQDRESHDAGDKGIKETLRSAMAKLKRRRENATDRMEHRREEDGDDKSSHSPAALTTQCANPHDQERRLTGTER